jgi:hypothetical protein
LLATLSNRGEKAKTTEATMALKRTILVLWLALAAVAAPSLGAAASAAAPDDDAALELAAMILTPTDLGLAGMAAYPIDQVSGMMQTAQATAQEFVEFEGATADRAQAVFVESGLQRHYQHFYLLTYPDAPDTTNYTARLVLTSVFEYPDQAKATAAFEPLAQLLGRDGPEATPAIAPIGDESREVGAGAEFSLTFRSGRLIVYITIRDGIGQPTQAEVETLASAILDHIQAVTSGGGPGLSRYVIRFPDDVVMTGPFEGYNLIAGNVIVRDNGYVDVFLPLLATAAAGAGALDGYDLSNALVMEGGGWAGDHGSTVYRFPDPDSAAAWLHELPERLATTTARELKVTAAPGIGDQAFLATYLSEPTDIIQAHRIGAVRVGSLVAVLTGSEVPPEAARQLLTAQAACLAEGGCSGPVPVPDGVI